MCSALNDFSLIHYNNLVTIAYGGKSVRHHNTGDAPVFDGFHHVVFGFGVQRTCRLVKKDDRGILREHARNLHALSLPAGKILSAFGQLILISALTLHYVLM